MKIILSVCLLVSAAIAALAQQPAPSPQRRAVYRGCCGRRVPRRVTPATPNTTPQTATPAAPDFFVGEAKVDVTKDETVIRLAMAQHASVLIELPANDGPRYIIPGDPEMATVDEKALERNKRAIVVRPGALFVAPPAKIRARTPAATVTAQMRSGLVVTFLFYPVEDLAQNVHRCVLSYNRDEVVARRRAAGLPVNLDTTTQERRTETGQSAAPISISVEPTDDAKPPDKESTKPSSSQPETSPKPRAEANAVASPLASPTDPPPLKPDGKANETASATTRAALARAIKKPGQFKKWTKPVHGLSLSIVQQSDQKADFRVVLIAVKNATTDTMKLTPSGPDLLVEMLDDQGKPLNIEPVKKLHTEVSDGSGTISSSATVYYAIAYSSPVLGVHQQVKVVVSQANAADEPASITLAINRR
jgi:hypothetical protein